MSGEEDYIMKTSPFIYIENLLLKNENFIDKKILMFFIFLLKT